MDWCREKKKGERNRNQERRKKEKGAEK